MKVVKLKIYQNLCNYRIETSFGYIQTYPLPTPSMIRGMIHSILDLTEYNPLKISIQGESEAIITNVQRVYKFDRAPSQRPDNPYKVTIYKSIKTATHGILFIDLLVNMNLIIHVNFFNNPYLNNELVNKIQEKIVVLGRNEDIALVEEVKLTSLDKVNLRSIKSKYPMYVTPSSVENVNSTIYRLPFYYEKVTSIKEPRIFKYVDAVYIGKGYQIKKEECFKDEDGDLVCFLGT